MPYATLMNNAAYGTPSGKKRKLSALR